MAEMQLVLQRAIYSRRRKRGEPGRAVQDGFTACLLDRDGWEGSCLPGEAMR